MGKRDECNQTEVDFKRDFRTVEHRPGGTYPGAEHGAMGGTLMLRMVPGMFDRLRLCESPDGQKAEHQEDRQEFDATVVHEKMA